MLLRQSMFVSWADLMNAPFLPGSEDVWSQVLWVYSSNGCSLRCFSWLPVYKITSLTLMTDYKALNYWEYFSDLLLHCDSSKPASLFSEKRCFACHTLSHLHHFNFPLVLFEPNKSAHIQTHCNSLVLVLFIYNCHVYLYFLRLQD